MKKRKLITIRELLIREGHWPGGIDPNKRYPTKFLFDYGLGCRDWRALERIDLTKLANTFNPEAAISLVNELNMKNPMLARFTCTG